MWQPISWDLLSPRFSLFAEGDVLNILPLCVSMIKIGSSDISMCALCSQKSEARAANSPHWISISWRKIPISNTMWHKNALLRRHEEKRWHLIFQPLVKDLLDFDLNFNLNEDYLGAIHLAQRYAISSLFLTLSIIVKSCSFDIISSVCYLVLCLSTPINILPALQNWFV